MAIEEHLAILPTRGRSIYRHPPQRAVGTTGSTPAKFDLLELLACFDVLCRNALKRLAVQAQLPARTLGVGVQVKGGQELSTLLDRANRQLVNIVEDKIDRACPLTQ